MRRVTYFFESHLVLGIDPACKSRKWKRQGIEFTQRGRNPRPQLSSGTGELIGISRSRQVGDRRVFRTGSARLGPMRQLVMGREQILSIPFYMDDHPY
jgi:hypothetical protein